VIVGGFAPMMVLIGVTVPEPSLLTKAVLPFG